MTSAALPATLSPKYPTLRRHGLAVCALLVLTVAVFSPLCASQFLSVDDSVLVAWNPDFHPPRLSRLAHYWWRPHQGLYIPLTYSIWGALATIAEVPAPGPAEPPLNPAVFHSANLGIHALAALLAYAILFDLFGGVWPAAVGAALFAVHPLQVEPVAWVTSLYTVLSGMLSLLAIWLYLRASSAGPSRTAQAWFAAATLAYVMALLAKPSALVVPLIIAAIELGLRARRLRQIWRGLTFWLLLAVPIVAATSLAQAGHITLRPPWYLRPLVALDALAFYLFKFCLPLRMLVDYGRSPAWLLQSPQTLFTWIAPTALLVTCLMIRRRRPTPLAPVVLTALAIFAAALLPVLGLAPFSFQDYSTVADRYAYLALLAPVALLTALLSGLRKPALHLAAVTMIALLALRSSLQARHWHDSFTLFQYTLEQNPRSRLGYKGLGLAYIAQHQPQRAIEVWQRALEAWPDDPEVHLNLAGALVVSGQPDQAVAHYRACLAKWDFPFIHHRLARALDLAGNVDEAEKQFTMVLSMAPNDAGSLAAYGTFLARNRRNSEAIAMFDRALAIDPAQPEALRGMASLHKEPSQ